MGLDVGLRLNGKFQNHFSFDDDGYYWFLYPSIEKLREQTGIYIDLYGDAEFHKGNIDQLESLIQDARVRMNDKPEYWQEHCGAQSFPQQAEIFYKVSKQEMRKKLDAIANLIREVKINGVEIIFTGD